MAGVISEAAKANGVQLMQSADVRAESLRWIRTLSGVWVEWIAPRNPIGIGRLRSFGDGAALAWRRPGSTTFGTPVPIVGSGSASYRLHDGEDRDSFVVVEAYPDNLPKQAAEAPVWITNGWLDPLCGGDFVSASEALAGDTSTTTELLKNWTDRTVRGLKVWLNASAHAYYAIRWNGVGSYVQPDAEDHADVLTADPVAAGDYETVQIRRLVPAVSASDPQMFNILEWAWDAYE